MGLEELKKHIMDDLNKKVSQIKKETEKEVKNIIKEANEEVKNYEKEKLSKLDKEKKDMLIREEALVELEGNKLIQEARRKAISSVFDKLRNKLNSLSDKEKKEIFVSLLKNAKKEIDINNIYVNKVDDNIVKDVIKSMKLKFKVYNEDILGGLIAENKDASIRADYSFDSLIHEFKQEVLSELSEKLFDNK